jgi:DNA repair exonuclease SbcCD nuclease subunit
MAGREVRLVHSSDLHVEQRPGAPHAHDELHPLREVLTAADAVAADVVLLAGDVFEHNRLPLALLDRATRLLAHAARPVVILPGNHDPLTPDSVYRRGGLADPPNVHVLGLSVAEAVVFLDLDLEIWGHAHQDYGDAAPLRDPRPRTTRWQVATAHGHFHAEPIDPHQFYGSWLIREADIAATAADYVALGHWNRPARVARTPVPAHYSGSPDYARTVNLVRLTPTGAVHVTRHQLDTSLPLPLVEGPASSPLPMGEG